MAASVIGESTVSLAVAPCVLPSTGSADSVAGSRVHAEVLAAERMAVDTRGFGLVDSGDAVASQSILPSLHRLQMPRVHAAAMGTCRPTRARTRYVACMVDSHACRDRPNQEFVGEPVRAVGACGVEGQLPVSTVENPEPGPAFVVRALIYPAPETVGMCRRRPQHVSVLLPTHEMHAAPSAGVPGPVATFDRACHRAIP